MRKTLSFPRILSHVGAFTLLSVSTAFAQSKYSNPITYGGITTVEEFLLALVDLIFLIAVPFIVICIIYAGFLFVSAGDNESQIAKARKVFLWTVIGAGVLLGAKAISLAIQNTINAL